MDNSNASMGGAEQEKQAQPSIPPKEDVVVKPLDHSRLVNLRTQSVIESPHDLAEKELRKIEERNAEILRQQKAAARAKKIRRVLIYIAIGLACLAFFAIIAWFIINVVLASQRPVGAGGKTTKTAQSDHSVIEGYDCTTDLCNKMADLPDGRILLRDGSYYIFDREAKTATLTTIDAQNYNSIKPFKWGDKILAVLDPETGFSALFSLSENRIITNYNYNSFYIDPNANIYKEMEWAVGSYIIAKNSSFRLIELSSGRESVRGANGVFMRDGFYFGYEDNGERRLYNSNGTQIRTAASGSGVYICSGQLIYVSADGGEIRFYNQQGQETDNSAFQDYIIGLEAERRVSTLNSNNDFYNIPTNRSF